MANVMSGLFVFHFVFFKEMSLPAMSIIYLLYKVFAAVRESRFEAASDSDIGAL